MPTNAQITAINTIAESPFGALGDLLLIPDVDAEAKCDFQDGSPLEHFYLGDIRRTDGEQWACCLRGIVKDALSRLASETPALH